MSDGAPASSVRAHIDTSGAADPRLPWSGLSAGRRSYQGTGQDEHCIPLLLGSQDVGSYLADTSRCLGCNALPEASPVGYLPYRTVQVCQDETFPRSQLRE